MKYLSFIIVVLLATLSVVANASPEQIDYLLTRYHDRLYPKVVYLDNNENVKCIKGLRNKSVPEIINSMDFSPECLWETIKKHNAESNERISERVLGFSYGSVIEASIYIGYTTGQELVIMQVDNETLMVGYVRYRGGSLSVSLSGPSLTQSVIYGDCDDQIFGYLGWFKFTGRMAITHQIGIYSNLFDSQYSGCNSIASTLGATSPIATIGATEYTQNGQFMLVKGPRIRPMINYLNKINAEKGFTVD